MKPFVFLLLLSAPAFAQDYPGDGYPNEVGKFEQYKALRNQVSNSARADALERWYKAFISYVPPSGPDDIDTIKSNVRRWRELKATEWALDHETPDDTAPPQAAEPPPVGVSATPNEPAPPRSTSGLPPSKKPAPPETKKPGPVGTVITGVSNIITLLVGGAVLLLMLSWMSAAKPALITVLWAALQTLRLFFRLMPPNNKVREVAIRWLDAAIARLQPHRRKAPSEDRGGAA